MQTFLPFEDFARSAKCLDRQRLGKQRVEVVQILNALANPAEPGGWVNNPAVRMWRGHGDWLQAYGIAICGEWISRGYSDSCLAKIVSHQFLASTRPLFLGDREFHSSHMSNLMRKMPDHYGDHFGELFPRDIPYLWPPEEK